MALTTNGSEALYVELFGQVYAAAIGNREFGEDAVFRKLVAANSGRSLELGCGSGRLLLRFAAEGHAVDGIDLSADMVALCRAEALQRGLVVNVFHGTFAPLAVDRTYALVYCPLNSFSLVADRSNAERAVRSIVGHLDPGGALALSASASFPEPHHGHDFTPRGSVQLANGAIWQVHESRRCSDEHPELIEVTRRLLTSTGDVKSTGAQFRRIWSPDSLAEIMGAAGLGRLHMTGTPDDYIMIGTR